MTLAKVSLNNGVEIPILGLGVYNTTSYDEMLNAVKWAMEAGYRSFDTAQMYKNEDILGNALQELKIKREDIFLTSKVNLGNMGYENTIKSFEQSISKLKTDYLDMFLIHWPGQQKDRLLDTYKALEDLNKDGKIRVIGVCNCEVKHLEWILESCEIPPAVNQVERHPLLNEKHLEAWCKDKNIKLEAWAPLMRGNLNLPQILAIAEKYKKTPAQVVLRWDVQDGYIVIPKSVHKERIFENSDIFSFELDKEDMETLSSMDQGVRTSFDPETFDF